MALLTWPALPVPVESWLLLSRPPGEADGPSGGALDSSVISVICKTRGSMILRLFLDYLRLFLDVSTHPAFVII